MITSSLTIGTVEAIPFTAIPEGLSRLVLGWRNDERVRLWMDSTAIIDWNEHCRFVDGLKTRTDRVYLLVKKDQQPMGVINLTEIDFDDQSAQLGLYRRPDEPGRNHGKILLATIEHVAVHLGLNRLGLKVKTTNRRATQLYETAGYTITRFDQQYSYMEKEL